MPETPEYLTTSRFYFEITGNGGSQSLLISKCSGVGINIDVAGEGAPLGVTKGAKTQTQYTVTGTTYQNVSLEFVVTKDNDILENWYNFVHPTSYAGGGTDWEKSRNEASLVFYKANGEEGARFNFVDAIPAKYSSTALSPDSTDYFKEKLEVAHAGLVRVK
jgi:phage tail-like protein